MNQEDFRLSPTARALIDGLKTPLRVRDLDFGIDVRHFDPVLRRRVESQRLAAPRIRGQFRLRILSAGRILLRETDWMENLVTDIGMDRTGAAGAIGSFCRIGTGNTTPANADTALVSQSASTSNTVAASTTNVGSPNYETQATTTFEFVLGAVNGNMAEIGLGWSASTASTLGTRALIVDGGGSPTTITVLSSEILQVVYRITFYPVLTDVTGTVTIGGVSYNYTSRASNVASALAVQPTNSWLASIFSATVYNGALGATTAAPSGTSAGLTTGSFSTYTSGNFYRDFSVSAALAGGNVSGGISAARMSLGGGGAVFVTQMSFAAVSGGAAIPKDSTKTISLTFRQPWSRH